ncbi:MAG: D-alanine--D-alanine ligase [Candidatus Margulisiibacteriota bacterium]
MTNIKEKLKNKKIAVLYGGVSNERDVSLRSGKNVFDAIVSMGLDAVLIDTKDKTFISRLSDKKIDIACIMLHGRGGEDGSIQGLLEIMGIPYTGSKVLASSAAMNKVASKRIWEAVGVPTPKYKVIDPELDLDEQCEKIKKYFPFPIVVKPVSEGSSFGVSIIKKEAEFFEAVKKTVKEYREVFVEEFIKGKEITTGILGTGAKAKALPVLELKPNSDFYDYKAKYTAGGAKFIIPARLPKAVYNRTQRAALKAYKSLGCGGFARIDAIIDKDGVAYAHDANTIPGMTDLSDLPAQAKAGGISYEELVLHILASALE